MSKVIIIRNIPGKMETHFGENAQILPGESITLFGVKNNLWIKDKSGARVQGSADYSKSFKLGDLAEWGSYNTVRKGIADESNASSLAWDMAYIGKIVQIGPKTVTIQDTSCGGGKKRLTIELFSMRNWDFDLDAIRERNSSWND